MDERRIQRAVSADGTEIVGRVIGQGPPLVLVHGAIGDGEFAWTELLPHLTDRFTCYLPSTRGRGLSGDHPDHSLPRLQEDVDAFADDAVRQRYLAQGTALPLGSPDEFAAHIAAERQRWGEVIRQANIRLGD